MPSEEAPSFGLWGAASVLLLADRFDPALRAVDQALADARRRGAVYLYAGASMVRASVLHARGSLIEAEADARAAVDSLVDRQVLIAPMAFGHLARVLVERGLLEDAVGALASAGA